VLNGKDTYITRTTSWSVQSILAFKCLLFLAHSKTEKSPSADLLFVVTSYSAFPSVLCFLVPWACGNHLVVARYSTFPSAFCFLVPWGLWRPSHRFFRVPCKHGHSCFLRDIGFSDNRGTSPVNPLLSEFRICQIDNVQLLLRVNLQVACGRRRRAFGQVSISIE
jgi:hypothetical protein